MTTLCGNFTRRFADATHGLVVGINLDARWDRVDFEVESATKAHVQLRGLGSLPIQRDRHRREFVTIENQCPMGRLMEWAPERHRVYAFVDERAAARRAASKDGEA